MGGGLAATGAAVHSWLLVGIGLIVLGIALWFTANARRSG
ncbi:LPXTG cell wall anchor domain-containing protein [Micromonospora sp. NPDC126480]